VTAAAMRRGRAEAATRRHDKVLAAIGQAAREGGDITVAAIARRAGVDRSFLYRHRELLERIHSAQVGEPRDTDAAARVSHQSLRVDLANAHERNQRLRARVQHLERRLSEALGEQVWREAGLGAPPDLETLQRQVVMQEQRIVELTKVVADRDRDLAAARAANRELMIRLNTPTTQPGSPTPPRRSPTTTTPPRTPGTP